MSTYLGKNKAKLISCAYAVLAVLTANSAYAANGLQIELAPISKISTYDLWSTLSPQQAESGEVVAAYWSYDPESGHYIGKQKICGVLLLGSPDVGSQPSGFEIRGGNCNYTLGTLKSVTRTFYLRDTQGNQEAIRIALDGKINMRGKVLGRLEF